MSGNSSVVTCPSCRTENKLRGMAMTRALTCSSCNTYFRTGSWDRSTAQFQHKSQPSLPIGSRGRIDGYLYEVFGFAEKQETKYHYRWKEYLVFNPYRGYAFLSEYDGHWNFIWPIEAGPKTLPREGEVTFEGIEYNLYQRYSCSVVNAKGEFFFDVLDLTDESTNYEYIAPPYLLALEKTANGIMWCKGEYFSREDIASAFSIAVDGLPKRTGIGYTQPFNTSFKDHSLIRITVILLLLVIAMQIFFAKQADEKTVLNQDYNSAMMKDQKMLVTPSFELAGGRQNLEVYVFAPVTNDWFFGDFELINETTGETYNFSKEVEYYMGYEDGESWHEGSTSGEAILSQIPGGKYHLNIYPDFGPSNQQFSVIVTRDVAFYSNFWITIAALLVFPLVYFFRQRWREQQRWSDSEFSPYESDE